MSAVEPTAVAGGAVASALDWAERSPETTRTRTITYQDPAATAAAAAGMSGLEFLRAIASGEVPPPPIGVLMRMNPVELEQGRAVFEGEPAEEHYNPIGTVHGGFAASILDGALGCAVHTTLPTGVGYTTQTLELKLVRPITADTGRVRAEAEIVHIGKRQATSQARLVAIESGKLLAHGTSTCMILG